MQPVNGWEHIQDATGGSPVDLDVDGVPRGMLAWMDNDRTPHLAIGTHTKCYAFIEGVLTEITPAGFTTGDQDATIVSGQYGDGVYGAFSYGVGNPAQEKINEADSWAFDNFGELLIAVATSDETLYSWDLNTGNNLAALGGTPPTARSVVVTPERFVVALGADGDGRLVQWSDQEDKDTWTETATNQAGSFPLSTPSDILAGRRARNETLIWTGHDIWAMRFIGGDFVYTFQQLGAQCGAISRRAMSMVDGKAVWMSHRSFFVYDGFVKPVPSEVSDYVFNDINRTQASKIWAQSVSEFREVWWFYPSAGSTEIDRYVIWNYDEDFWIIGNLERTAGVDRGAFGYPIMADSQGRVYAHEQDGGTYDDPDDTALTPEATSGPVELGNGDRLLHIQQLIPDENTLGDVQVKLHAAAYPTATETIHGPFTLSEPTDIRVTARQVRLEVEQVNSGWRVGVIRFDAVAGEVR